jgi:hypothetical protein
MLLTEEAILRKDLEGPMAIRFKTNRSLNMYCAEHITGYDPDRYEAVALQLYYEHEPVITVYAIDKTGQHETEFDPEKMPVKKFKRSFDFLKDLLPLIKECNFTVITGYGPLLKFN